jgi:hypothetical protein
VRTAASPLTAAQRLALEVLDAADRPLATWKRQSRHRATYGSTPGAVAPAKVNHRAAESLDRLGYARLRLTYRWESYEVEITEAGRAILRDG